MCKNVIQHSEVYEFVMKASTYQYQLYGTDKAWKKKILGIGVRVQNSSDNAMSSKGRKLVTAQALDSAFLVLSENGRTERHRIPLSVLKSTDENPWHRIETDCIDTTQSYLEIDSTAFAALVTANEAVELYLVTEPA
jgi:hypothetical protein